MIGWLVTLVLAAAATPFDLVPPLALDAPLAYDFVGSTMVSRNYVKLTGDHPDQRGYIVSNTERPFPANFELTMDFQVGGGGRNMYGDGMVLWLLQHEPKSGPMFALDEFYKGVAIAVDTYRNGRGGRVFPRLVLMKNDGRQAYDKDNDGNLNELGSCALRGIHDNRRQEFSSMRISYSSERQLMSVEVNFRKNWEVCVSAHLDLGDVKKIAVSAATGELVERHIVKRIELLDFGDDMPTTIKDSVQGHPHANAEDQSTPEMERELRTRGGGFFNFVGRVIAFIVKSIAVVGLLFGAYKAFRAYMAHRKMKENNKYKLG